jgi:hypothetical protein
VQAQDTKFWITRVGVPYVGGTPGPAGPPGESPPADGIALTAYALGPNPWSLPITGRSIVPLNNVPANELVELADPTNQPGVLRMKVGGLFYVTFGSWGDPSPAYVRIRSGPGPGGTQIGGGSGGSGVMMWTAAAGTLLHYEIEGSAGIVTNDIGMMFTDMRRTV